MHRIIRLSVLGVLVVACATWLQQSYLSNTRIAFVNVQPVAMQKYTRANSNRKIKLMAVDTADLHRLRRADVVIINGMGLHITAGQRDYMRKLAGKGKPFITMMATNPDNDICNLSPDESRLILQYNMHGGHRNHRSMLNLLRRNVDGKISSIGEILPPDTSPGEYLYYPTDQEGGDEVFPTVQEFEEYMEKHGLFHEGAPRVVVTGAVTDLSELITALADSGLNVYPVSSMMHLTRFLKEIHPRAVVNSAHGRVGDQLVEYLKAYNVLLFDPVYVNATIDDWEKDPMGMMGGFMSQSIVMPELDGAIRTSALFALKEDSDGLLMPCAIPGRLGEFVTTMKNYLSLRSKSNSQKRIAIVYFKGPGQNGLVASGLDVVPSLYNLLKRLQQEGYNLKGLPTDITVFQRQLQKEGSLFSSFAAGDAEKYLKNGHPRLVSRKDYDSWCAAALPRQLRSDVDSLFGPFPGIHNQLVVSDSLLAFPNIQYGNVVLIPQPLSGEGHDEFRIVHGTKQAPPHSYVAPYLWIQKGFRADALIHFGTHGSLEFTPRKQIALSCYDWPDRLIGTLPHFYLYTIDNVGEAMTARRRSYAGLQSYLTPPFHESELRSQFKTLDHKLSHYESSKNAADKARFATDIKRSAIRLGLAADLGLDSNLGVAYSEDDILRISNYKEELATEKITDRPYILGIPYVEDDIRASVGAMTTDPLAYNLYALDRRRGRAPEGLEQQRAIFNARYLERAKQLVASSYNAALPLTDKQLADLMNITTDQLDSARAFKTRQHASKGMAGMMQNMSKMKSIPPAAQKEKIDGIVIPKAKNSPFAKLMRKKVRRTMAAGGTLDMQEITHKTGTGDETLRKTEHVQRVDAADSTASHPHKGRANPLTTTSGTQSSMVPASEEETMPVTLEEAYFYSAINEVEAAVNNVTNYRNLLRRSPQLELTSLMNALNGGYTAPSPGGDPIVNPNTLPTGRNLFAINAEETPTEDAWQKGMALANSTIDEYRRKHGGQYPRKVAYNLWSGEFIQTGGATIAQVLYLLGVEPVRDRYGRVNDLRLIPSKELGRPRIDVVCQTSGQLRDLAASRLFLVTRAVQIAAKATGDEYENMVQEGVHESERTLIGKGISPKHAREMSHYRIFGGLNGGYGTGIQGMVEQGNAWDDSKDIAEVYLNNMGAYYGDDNNWQSNVSDAFEAALTRTDVVMQPRQNNTWGALSLDHVYEFMGGMNMAVRQVTGEEPEAYFSDYRNRNNYHIQSSHDAIVTEARTKLLNQTYIQRCIDGGINSSDAIAEMTRNLYGWNVTKPTAVDESMWNEIYDVYVEDKYGMNLGSQMEQANHVALQQMAATMLETSRKGMWHASEEQVARLAEVYTDLVNRYGPGGDAFDGANPKLQDYAAQHAPQVAAQQYIQQMKQMTVASADANKKAQVLQKKTTAADNEGNTMNVLIIVIIMLIHFVALVIFIRVKRRKE